MATRSDPPSRSAVDEIVARIRAHITESRLAVGDRLPTERELCERFGASRNTVREAMRILTAYGQVEVRPKIGATLIDQRMTRVFDLFSLNTMDLSVDTFEDVQAFRSWLEIGPAETLFARVSADDIAELRAINAGLATATSIPHASRIDFHFHLRLVSILGNKTIRDVYEVLKPVILRIMEAGKTRHVFKSETQLEHAAVIDALEARDPVAFRARLHGHLMVGSEHFAPAVKKPRPSRRTAPRASPTHARGRHTRRTT